MAKGIGGIREKRKRTDGKKSNDPVLTMNEFEWMQNQSPGNFSKAEADELAAGRMEGLTDAEINLVYSYTGSMAYTLNGYILDGNKNPFWRTVEDKLDKVLDKLKLLNYKGITFRGMSLSKGAFADMKPDQVVSILKNNEYFQFDTFVSSSERIDKATNFVSDAEVSVIFEIKGKTGKIVKYLSQHEGEDEILFKSKTKFKFIGSRKQVAKYGSEYTFIEIEEL